MQVSEPNLWKVQSSEGLTEVLFTKIFRANSLFAHKTKRSFSLRPVKDIFQLCLFSCSQFKRRHVCCLSHPELFLVLSLKTTQLRLAGLSSARLLQFLSSSLPNVASFRRWVCFALLWFQLWAAKGDRGTGEGQECPYLLIPAGSASVISYQCVSHCGMRTAKKKKERKCTVRKYNGAKVYLPANKL